MKNQYFGDINDYRKYGLLRILTGWGEMSTAVCWMLTCGDGRSDGKFIKYLVQPEKWRCFDPDLYDKLRELVVAQGIRDVAKAEGAGIISSARFYNEILYDDGERRSRYFKSFRNAAQGCDLVFFDPDNGLEVKSKPFGRKGSSKYLYWDELDCTFSGGYSVLVYQHFPREKREHFIARIAKEIGEKIETLRVYSFRTARVVFFLLPSERHVATFERNVCRVSELWGCQIKIQRHET